MKMLLGPYSENGSCHFSKPSGFTHTQQLIDCLVREGIVDRHNALGKQTII
jgi:hypothetical protein